MGHAVTKVSVVLAGIIIDAISSSAHICCLQHVGQDEMQYVGCPGWCSVLVDILLATLLCRESLICPYLRDDCVGVFLNSAFVEGRLSCESTDDEGDGGVQSVSTAISSRHGVVDTII